MFGSQPYHLHGYGAAAAGNSFGVKVLPDSPAKRQNIKTGMVHKALILKGDYTLFKFFRDICVWRETPLPISSNGCAEQLSVGIVYYIGGGAFK
jgi:hypothetical protein